MGHATTHHDSRTALAIAAAVSNGRRAASPVSDSTAACHHSTSRPGPLRIVDLDATEKSDNGTPKSTKKLHVRKDTSPEEVSA